MEKPHIRFSTTPSPFSILFTLRRVVYNAGAVKGFVIYTEPKGREENE